MPSQVPPPWWLVPVGDICIPSQKWSPAALVHGTSIDPSMRKYTYVPSCFARNVADP